MRNPLKKFPLTAALRLYLGTWFTCVGDSGEKEVVAGEGLERFGAIAQVHIIGVGQAAEARVRRGGIDLDNPAGIRDRQRTEQHRIDVTEHRGVGADAEGEGEDGNEREAGRLGESADGKAEIGRKSHTDLIRTKERMVPFRLRGYRMAEGPRGISRRRGVLGAESGPCATMGATGRSMTV